MKNSDLLGTFISFEGIEGSGKTTQIQRLKDKLESTGHDVLLLREPGGTQFGEQLRAAILGSPTPLAPVAEAMLFASSRAQLIKEKILPHLFASDKNVVLVDRFIDSSFVYQGVAREMGIETINSIHQFGELQLRPHKTIFLDISLKTSMERQKSRGNTPDYFEKESSQFYQDLINGFHQCAKLYHERFSVINGERSADEIHQDILKAIEEVL